MNLEKFDGKVGEWDNWYHQFEFLATSGVARILHWRGPPDNQANSVGEEKVQFAQNNLVRIIVGVKRLIREESIK